MNAGDPARHGFKLCARCHTWVLQLVDLVLDGDPKLDEMGRPVQVCRAETYCAKAQVHMQTLAAVAP